MSVCGVLVVTSCMINFGLAVFDTNNMASMGDMSESMISPEREYAFPQEISMLNARPLLDKVIGLNPGSNMDKLETGDEQQHGRFRRRAKGLHDAGPDVRIRERLHHYRRPRPIKEKELPEWTTTKRPGILPENMNAGVIFRVRMSDAILRIKQRMYDNPEKHIKSDILYTNQIRKVVSDEITKFHNLLLLYKTDRSIKEHMGECGGRLYKFIAYMSIKVHIHCLFDTLWIDGIPYVIGDDYTVTPLDKAPMLQCDAAECNAVLFVDSEPKAKV